MLDVRKATAEDCSLLCRLGAETYRSAFPDIWSPNRMEAYIAGEFASDAVLKSLDQPDRAVWMIAETQGVAIGFAKLNWSLELPVAQGMGVPRPLGTELQKLYFQAAHLGRGHGARMIDAIVAAVKAHEAGTRTPLLWLQVLKSNARARAFYGRHGFEVVEQVPFGTDLKEIGLWVMARRLA